jgi:hypothetical protein
MMEIKATLVTWDKLNAGDLFVKDIYPMTIEKFNSIYSIDDIAFPLHIRGNGKIVNNGKVIKIEIVE